MASKQFLIEERPIDVKEYLTLRASTNWSQLSSDQVKQALANDLYSVCVKIENQTVGMARIIGDGAIYFYIQDLIVLPEYQKQGIGRLIMECIEQYFKNKSPVGSFIGLMAAEGTVDFYQRFGYEVRSDLSPGMFKYNS